MSAPMVVGYQIPEEKKKPYWWGAFICTCLSIFCAMLGGASADYSILQDDIDRCRMTGDPADVGYPEYDTCTELEDAANGSDTWMYIFCVTCLLGLVMMFLAITASGGSKKQTVIVQHQRPVVVQQPVAVQQPVVQGASPVQSTPNIADQRKSAHLDRAHQMEMAGDLAGAITAYELAEEYREAQRVRTALSTQGQQAQGNVNIQIGKVGDTTLHDSVMMDSDKDSND